MVYFLVRLGIGNRHIYLHASFMLTDHTAGILQHDNGLHLRIQSCFLLVGTVDIRFTCLLIQIRIFKESGQEETLQQTLCGLCKRLVHRFLAGLFASPLIGIHQYLRI